MSSIGSNQVTFANLTVVVKDRIDLDVQFAVLLNWVGWRTLCYECVFEYQATDLNREGKKRCRRLGDGGLHDGPPLIGEPLNEG